MIDFRPMIISNKIEDIYDFLRPNHMLSSSFNIDKTSKVDNYDPVNDEKKFLD